MLLNDSEESRNALCQKVEEYYKNKNKNIYIFSMPQFDRNEEYEISFLVNRKHVVKYCIGHDRGIYLCAVLLAIGPHYFGPADFWSYKDSERFTLEASTEGVQKNLELLDEFLAYTNI